MSSFKVLIATDGSASAERAIREALKVARLDAAQVLVIAAQDPAQRIGGNQDAEADLAGAKAILEAAGVSPACEVVRGAPAEAILARAQAFRPDLLVMGSSGRGALGRLVLGSVSGAVLAGWSGPVLVVREPA